MASLKKRNGQYYAQWYEGTRQRRASLRTDSLQIAKARLRKVEARLEQGDENPLPTRTAIGTVLGAYVRHVRTHKTGKSAQTDIAYLRQAFGECCPELANSSRRTDDPAAQQARKGRRRTPGVIDAACFEAITTQQVSEFLERMVRDRAWAPKTANRYREVLCRLFNWAIEENRVRMPGDRNPVAKVRRYRERAPEIRYLTLPQIDEQLHALRDRPQLRVMVATLIYAGLRREELLWLRVADFARSTPQAPNGLLRIQAKTVGGESWQPKTRTNRAVPVSRDLQRILEDWHPKKSEHGWLFPSPHGTRWDPDNFSADLREANRSAGLVWGCLDYRHTFGSQLAQRGVSLFQIATLMGNSPAICQRHYATLSPASMVSLVDFSEVSTSVQSEATQA